MSVTAVERGLLPNEELCGFSLLLLVALALSSLNRSFKDMRTVTVHYLRHGETASNDRKIMQVSRLCTHALAFGSSAVLTIASIMSDSGQGHIGMAHISRADTMLTVPLDLQTHL